MHKISDTFLNARMEQLSRDELTQLQNDRLKKILAWSMGHNQVFFNRMRDAGLSRAEDFRGLDDLSRLPFMSKEDFRFTQPFGMMCVDPADVAEIHMSSGSTGEPVVMPYTRQDLEQWAECMARCYVMAGAKPGDVCQIMPAFGLFNGGFGCYHGARKLGLLTVPSGAVSSVRQLFLAKNFGTRIIVSVVTAGIRFMEKALQSKTELPQLKIGIFGAEPCSSELKKRLHSALGVEVFDVYGMTETGGIGTLGMDCRDHSGIHQWEDQYIIEIIDPATGKNLPDGQTGEIVVTALTREALPVIRFRTGDLSEIISREKCACGRTHLRVAPVRGRIDDMLIVSGVNFFPQQVEQSLLKIPGVMPEYSLKISTRNGIKSLCVSVEAVPGVSEIAVVRQLKEDLGFTPECHLCEPGSLPRLEGKAKRVVHAGE